ncbi:MAG: hypothetical protein GX320_10160 [Tissierellia bacterium]|nr:hypothetical protein [Tissierellia bacterium]
MQEKSYHLILSEKEINIIKELLVKELLKEDHKDILNYIDDEILAQDKEDDINSPRKS